MAIEYFSMVEKVFPYLPNLVFIAVIAVLAFIAHGLTDRIYMFLQRRFSLRPSAYGSYIIHFFIWATALLLILLNIPGISTNILQLFGLIAGGIVAFSSSTIIANGMSGVLLKLLKQYKIGDMVEFEGVVGEVTEISFFHTEIQTIWRKLVTIPNSVMMSQKFSNLSETGSIISAKVSIGYEIPRTKVEVLLLKAAHTVNLEGPWASVIELGNYTITYQINGLLRDIGKMVVAQSQLHKEILDEFSKARVDIMSPMYHRMGKYDNKVSHMAKYTAEESLEEIQAAEERVEKLLFEKAAREKKVLAKTERATSMLSELEKKCEELERAAKSVKDKFLKKKLKARLEETEHQKELLKVHIIEQKRKDK